MPEAVKRRPVVVHLGNVLEGTSLDADADKTRRYAESFPDVQFVGIDVLKLKGVEGKANWVQYEAEFIEGLEELDDNSVYVISSDRALGERGRRNPPTGETHLEYTKKVLEVAYRKLEDGGKLMLSVNEMHLDTVKAALKDSPFKEVDIEIRPFTEREYNRTYWTKWAKDVKQTLYQVTAKK